MLDLYLYWNQCCGSRDPMESGSTTLIEKNLFLFSPNMTFCQVWPLFQPPAHTSCSCFLFQAVGDFAHFEQLRWEDQEKIRQRIEAGPGPGKKSTFFATVFSRGEYTWKIQIQRIWYGTVAFENSVYAHTWSVSTVPYWLIFFINDGKAIEHIA